MVDGCRRRRDPHREDGFAEERIHERRLAVVELAHDDQMKPILIELSHEIGVDALAKALRPDGARHVREPRSRCTTSSRRPKNASRPGSAATGDAAGTSLITRLPSGWRRRGCRPRSS